MYFFEFCLPPLLSGFGSFYTLAIKWYYDRRRVVKQMVDKNRVNKRWVDNKRSVVINPGCYVPCLCYVHFKQRVDSDYKQRVHNKRRVVINPELVLYTLPLIIMYPMFVTTLFTYSISNVFLLNVTIICKLKKVGY